MPSCGPSCWCRCRATKTAAASTSFSTSSSCCLTGCVQTHGSKQQRLLATILQYFKLYPLPRTTRCQPPATMMDLFPRKCFCFAAAAVAAAAPTHFAVAAAIHLYRASFSYELRLLRRIATATFASCRRYTAHPQRCNRLHNCSATSWKQELRVS